jgi:hypothetical protein
MIFCKMTLTYDADHNDTKYNVIEHNDTLHNHIKNDHILVVLGIITFYKLTLIHNDIQHIYTKHNDIQYNNTQQCGLNSDTQLNNFCWYARCR